METPATAPPQSLHPAHVKKTPPPPLSSFVALVAAAEGAPQRPYSHSWGFGPGTSAWCPECGAKCLPLPRRGGWEGGNVEGGKAIAGLSPWGFSGVPTTPPSQKPHQFWATMVQMAMAAQLGLPPALPA